MTAKKRAGQMEEEHEKSIAKMLAYAKRTENRGALCKWISICIEFFFCFFKF